MMGWMAGSRRSLVPLPDDDEGSTAAAGLPLFVVAEQLGEAFLARLLEHPVSGQPARLDGFEQVELATVAWSVIRPAEGAHVDGLLYRVLTAEDFRRLDAYCGVSEGLYRRLPVTVMVESDAEPVEETAVTYLPTAKTLRRYR